MTTETTTAVAVSETLKAEGSELAAIAKKRGTRDRREFKRDIEADGFGVRLGQLMLDLEAATEGERIPSATLKAVGVNIISSALRSEWKWFVLNETSAREFIKASKKGFTNVSALKSAMAKAAKAEAKAEASTEGDSESEATEGEASENVYARQIAKMYEAVTEGETVSITVKSIVMAISIVAERDGVTIEQVLTDVIDAIEAPLNGSTQPSIAA